MPYGVGGAVAEGLQSGFEMGRGITQDAESRRRFDIEEERKRAAEERLAKQEDDRYGRMHDEARVTAIKARIDHLQKLTESIVQAGHKPDPDLLMERAQLSAQYEDMLGQVAQTGRLAPTSAGVIAAAPRPNVASADTSAPLPNLSQAAPSGVAGGPQAQSTPAPGGVGTSAGAAPQGLGPQPGPVGMGVDGLAPPGALPASAAAPPAPAVPGGAPQAAAAASPTTSAVTPNQALVTGEDQKAQDLASRLNTGQMSLNQVAPGDFAMMMTSALKRAPTADAMGEVRQGLADFHAGMQTGNNGLTIQGLNGVYGPQVNQGVGQPSDFGGNVVSKKVVGLDPAMSADGTVHPDRVMPRLQVATDALGPDGAPLTYHAPMLGADGKVAAIPMTDAMNHLGATGALLEAAAHPDAQALLAKGAADPRVAAYLQAFQQQAEPVSKAQIVENHIQAYMARNHVDRTAATQAFIDAGDLPYHPLKGTAPQDFAAAQQLMAADPQHFPDLISALREVGAMTHGITKYSPLAAGGGAAPGGAGAGVQGAGPAVGGKLLPGSDVMPAPDKNGMVMGTSPRAIDDAAVTYAMTRKLPSISRSKDNIPFQKLIMARAGELMDNAGISSADFATMPDEYKTQVSSLMKQQSKVDAVTAVLNSLHNNMDTFDSIAKGQAPAIGGERVQAMTSELRKIDFGSIRDFNELRVKIGEHLNDPAMTAYAVAAMAVAMDAARIQTGGAQSVAQTAEGARKAALDLVSAGVNDSARKALLGSIESDSMGQIKGMTDQLGTTKASLHRFGGSTGSPAPVPGAAGVQGVAPPTAPAKKLVYDPVTGTIH